MKSIKGVLVALIAMAALALAAPSRASIVTMDGTSTEGDIAHVVFSVDDSSHGVMGVTGWIDVAGATPVLSILGLVPTSESGDRFLFNNLYNPADGGATGFDWYGMAFFIGDLATKANLYDDTGGLVFAMSPGGDGTAYIPGHILNDLRISTVHEPATLLLFGLGIAGIMVSGRRKTLTEKDVNSGSHSLAV